MLGKLLAAPLRIVNAPIRAVEAAVAVACGEDPRDAERVLSATLNGLAKGVERVVDEVVRDD